MVFPLLLFAAAVEAQIPPDGFDPNANGAIQVTLVQPDGKILIGGSFTELSPNGGTTVTRNRLARLNPDGTLDTAFNPNADNSVLSLALQGDGKILVGGNFTNIGGQTRNYIARLDGATGLADPFNPNPNNPFALASIYSIAVQADHKILVAGNFSGIGGQMRGELARLDPATGLADSFDPNPNSFVYCVAVQADGKILVGGAFDHIAQSNRNRIARLDPMTGLADSFNPNANGFVYSMAIQGDRKILVGGNFNQVNGGQVRNHIARFDSTTGLADSFDPNADGTHIYSIAVQADGKILAGGDFSFIGGEVRDHIARLNPNTGLADSFDPNPNGIVTSIAVQSDGKVLAGGAFNTFVPNGGASIVRNNIVRLEADGSVDQTFVPGISGGLNEVLAIVPQANGKILVGGEKFFVGQNLSYFTRLNRNGSVDSTFNPPHLNDRVRAIAVQRDDMILVGGDFTQYFIRVDPVTGLIDTSFHPNAVFAVTGIAVQPDGKILVAGGLSALSRLNTDGNIDPSFHVDLNSSVFTIVVQPDGKILIGGFFTAVNGLARNYIVRLNPDGTVDLDFNPFPDRDKYNLVIAIALQPDGKILVGGRFTNIGDQSRNNFARLDGSTGMADSLDAQADGTVEEIALQADGKIIVAGGFLNIGGEMRDGFARLDGTTGLADSFAPEVYPLSLALQSDGKILTSGFSQFVRLPNETAAIQGLTASRTELRWSLDGASTQFSTVGFEFSPNNVNYTPLGFGTASGNTWTLTGLNLPTRQNIYVRALGYHSTGQYNSSQTIVESIRNTYLPQPATLANVSTRLVVQTGDNAMIGGFIITGTQPKTVIVRGIGPSLALPGALVDPIIEVHGSSGELLATNDNWMSDPNHQHVIDNGLAPTNELESALWGIINPGAYTVVVRGNNNTSGVGLFEVYDLDQTVDSRLGNISTRGYVATGNSVMIGGTIIVGDEPGNILIRAIGPSLTSFGVPNALQDPTLGLHDGNGALLASNDNWRSDQEAEIIATGIPPSNDLEAAILADLAPGNYTAIVRGANNTTGVGVVEAYGLN